MPQPALAYVAAPRHVGDGWLQTWVDRLRSYATTHGLSVTKVYVDDRTTHGAGYLGLTSDLDSGVAGVVITPNVSHLERCGASRHALRERGAAVLEVEIERTPARTMTATTDAHR